MSWLATGDASANYSIDSSGFSMTLDGTHQEKEGHEEEDGRVQTPVGAHGHHEAP